MVFGDDDFPGGDDEEEATEAAEEEEAEEEEAAAEEAAEDEEDPFAMMAGMGEEEVYKETLTIKAREMPVAADIEVVEEEEEEVLECKGTNWVEDAAEEEEEAAVADDDEGGNEDPHDPIPEILSCNKNFEKRNKKVSKEGGKRGVEIEGAADMGGLQFFCTSVDEPAGV